MVFLWFLLENSHHFHGAIRRSHPGELDKFGFARAAVPGPRHWAHHGTAGFFGSEHESDDLFHLKIFLVVEHNQLLKMTIYVHHSISHGIGLKITSQKAGPVLNGSNIMEVHPPAGHAAPRLTHWKSRCGGWGFWMFLEPSSSAINTRVYPLVN